MPWPAATCIRFSSHRRECSDCEWKDRRPARPHRQRERGRCLAKFRDVNFLTHLKRAREHHRLAAHECEPISGALANDTQRLLSPVIVLLDALDAPGADGQIDEVRPTHAHRHHKAAIFRIVAEEDTEPAARAQLRHAIHAPVPKYNRRAKQHRRKREQAHRSERTPPAMHISTAQRHPRDPHRQRRRDKHRVCAREDRPAEAKPRPCEQPPGAAIRAPPHEQIHREREAENCQRLRVVARLENNQRPIQRREPACRQPNTTLPQQIRSLPQQHGLNRAE